MGITAGHVFEHDWLFMPGDRVTTSHGAGTIVCPFDFPYWGVRMDTGRVLSFRQDELTA